MYTSNTLTLTVTAADTMPAWAAALVPGQCAIISKNTLASVWEGAQPAGGGTIYKAAQAWTSGVDAPDLGQYGSKLFAGGGDADSWDTAVYAFGYATQRWSRLKDRTTALGWNPDADKALPVGDPHHFDCGYCEHGDGTPAAPHTYDLMTAIPGGFVYAATRFAYTQDGSNWAHKFTLADKQWSRIGTAEAGINGAALGMADYDPATGRIWIVPATPSGFSVNRIEWLDPLTGARGSKGLSTDYLIKSGTLRVWGHYLVWLGAGGLSVLDVGSNSGIIATTPLAGIWDGWGFVQGPDAFYAMPANASGALLKITPPTGDPMTAPWLASNFTLGGTLPTGAANGIWKRLHWVDSLRCLTWWYEAGGHVYAYKP